MGKCISKSSVIVVDVSRTLSEKSNKATKYIKDKIGIHDYTPIKEEESNTIPYTYEDDDDDVVPDMNNEKDEIDDIFDDNEVNSKI